MQDNARKPDLPAADTKMLTPDADAFPLSNNLAQVIEYHVGGSEQTNGAEPRRYATMSNSNQQPVSKL